MKKFVCDNCLMIVDKDEIEHNDTCPHCGEEALIEKTRGP